MLKFGVQERRTRNKRYRLYSGDLATVHESNNLDELIERARLVTPYFDTEYTVRDIDGKLVWRGNDDQL